MASDERQPRKLAVDSRNVYWINDYEIIATPKHGGRATVLAVGIATPECISSDGRHVYWLDGGSVGTDGKLSRVPVEGGSVEVLAADLAAGRALAVDDEFVYWAAKDQLMRRPKAGGSTEPIAAHEEVLAIAADDVGVYWANAPRGRLPWIAMAGLSGRRHDLVPESAPGVSSSLAVGHTALCWTSWTSNPLAGGIFCLDSESAAPHRVAQANARVLTVSNRLLFWIRERTPDRSELVCTPLDGGTSAVLATGQITDLAADPIGVYYADVRGSVFAQDLLPQ